MIPDTFLDPATLWAYLTASVAAQVLLFSACVLFFALVLEIWVRAVRLSGFEMLDLRTIELDHPHLPSLSAVISIFLCSTSLLMVSLLSRPTTLLFSGPYGAIYLLALFILAAAIGAAAELRWRSAAQYTSAFLTGTSVAMLVLTTVHTRNELILLILQYTLILVCALLILVLLYRRWSWRAKVFAATTAALWFVAAILRL